MARKRLGELLLEYRIISRQQLEQALAYQRQTGHRLGAALVSLKFITELQLCDALATGLGLQAVRMPPAQLDWEALHTLRARFCEENDLFPLSLEGKSSGRRTLVVAMADPLNIPAIEEIEFTAGVKVVPVIAPLSGIREAIRRYYLKQHADPHPESPEKMTIIRPGGVEDVVSTGTNSKPPPPPARALAEPARARASTRSAEPEPEPEPDDEPVLQLGTGEYREVTERTALADLIEERARRQRKKAAAKPEKKPGGVGFDYLLGAPAGSDGEKLEKLERRFWALLRIMAQKGLITREEFLKELSDAE